MFTRKVFLLFRTCSVTSFRCKSSSKYARIDVIQKSLDLNYSLTYALIKKYPTLQTLDPDKLTATFDRLFKYNFTKNDIMEYPGILCVHDTTLLHQYSLLEEVGFKNLKIEILLNFLPLVRKSIATLKMFDRIPEEANVAENLLQYIDVAYRDAIRIDNLQDEELLLKDIISSVIRQYLALELDTSEEELKKYSKTYPKTYNRSLRHLQENLNILKEIGFNKDRIKRNWYLLSNNPENTRKILEEFPTIMGTDAKTLLYKHPKLLEFNVKRIKDTYEILQKYEIPDEYIKKTLSIFTIHPETLRKRLNDIHNIPELKVLAKHPRILHLVLYQNKAKSRLRFLSKMNEPKTTLNLLCSHEAAFEKFINEGYRTFGNDTIKLIGSELNISHLKGLREIFNSHPHWMEIPMTRIADTIRYLRDKRGFSNGDLKGSLHILFYPKEKIEAAYEEIAKEEMLMNKSIDERIMLKLLLYFMEKPFHFSGNGVWSINEVKTRTIH